MQREAGKTKTKEKKSHVHPQKAMYDFIFLL